jgi:hypothetical protein
MTDCPILPPEAAPALRYAEFFGPDARNRLAEDLRFFYLDEDFRFFQERLEFSMVFGEGCAPKLRYVLYRVHSGHAVVRLLDTRVPPNHDARGLIDLLGPLAPEFAVGVDQSPGRKRMKLYFMRLIPDSSGETGLASRVRKAALRMGVESIFAPGFDPGKTGIFSVDYYRESARREVKLYHWGLAEWQEKARGVMEAMGIRSCFAERFFTLTSDRPVQDAIFCHRYAPGVRGPTGFAIHQTVENRQKPSIEALLRELVPNGYAKCWEPLRRAEEEGGRVLVGHFGVSFALNPPSERLHLYFSVV